MNRKEYAECSLMGIEDRDFIYQLQNRNRPKLKDDNYYNDYYDCTEYKLNEYKNHISQNHQIKFWIHTSFPFNNTVFTLNTDEGVFSAHLMQATTRTKSFYYIQFSHIVKQYHCEYCDKRFHQWNIQGCAAKHCDEPIHYDGYPNWCKSQFFPEPDIERETCMRLVIKKNHGGNDNATFATKFIFHQLLWKVPKMRDLFVNKTVKIKYERVVSRAFYQMDTLLPKIQFLTKCLISVFEKRFHLNNDLLHLIANYI